MVSHLLLDFFFMMVGAMVFHEIGHYILYSLNYPGKAFIIFKDKSLYTDVSCRASKTNIKDAALGGLFFGLVPIILYSYVSVLFVPGFAFYFWGARHDIKLLWRMRK